MFFRLFPAEKLRRGEELKKQLRKELEEKKRLVELMKSQVHTYCCTRY